MNKIAFVTMGSVLAAVSSVLWAADGAGGPDEPETMPSSTSAPYAETQAWESSGQRRVLPDSLSVTAGGKYAVYAVEEKASEGGFYAPGWCLADLAKHSEERIEDTIFRSVATDDSYGHSGGVLIVYAQLYPAKDVMIVVAEIEGSNPQTGQGQRGQVLYVVDLAKRKAQAITKMQYLVTACWAGDSIAIAAIDEKGSVGPVRLVDTSGKQVRELPVYGLVVGASEDGQSLAVACQTEAPDKPYRASALVATDVNVIGIDRKSLRKMAPTREVAFVRIPPSLRTFFLLSPHGKFAVYQRITRAESSQMPAEWPSDPKDLQVVAVAADGTGKRVLDGALLPVGVTDAGEMLLMAPRPPAGGTALQAIGLDGKARVVAQGVLAAKISGDMVHYLVAGPAPVVKSAALPNAPK